MSIPTFEVDELTTPIFQVTLRVSLTGAVVPGSAITSITVWLYDLYSGTILNGRDGVSLSPSIVTEAGVMQWLMDEEDHAILDTTQTIERHRAEFEVRWDTPEKVMRDRVDFLVIAYARVPVVP